MKKKLFFLEILMCLFIIVSCDKGIDEILSEKQEQQEQQQEQTQLGIFVGAANAPVAYEINNNKATPLGGSLALKEVSFIDEETLQAVPEDKGISPFLCKKVGISKADYKPSAKGDDKCFGGLWFYQSKREFKNSLTMAIKPVNDYWEISIANLSGVCLKVTAQSAMTDGHQELIFELSSEITGRENSLWVLTASSIHQYNFDANLLNLVSRGDNFGDFFEFSAIHN